jgi:hypothetical protein
VNKIRLRFPCKIKNGKMVIDNKDEFTNAILIQPSGNYYIELKPTGVRSSQQNNYYWNIVDILGEELGYTSDEMHEVIKDHFNIPSTKELPKDEFALLVERLIRWSATELNIVIKDPNTLL